MDPLAAKFIGAGIACIGMGGAGVGVGTIFGSYLAAALRNPSAAQGQFGNLIFGFAVTEALGIFSLLIALLLLSCAPPEAAARRSAAQSGTNSRSNAISSEKMPSASVTAKPKIRLPNWPWAAEGLRTAAAR